MYLLDSSAWFNHFTGEAWARSVNPIIRSGDVILLSTVNLVEILSKYRMRSEAEADKIKSILLSRCQVVDVTQDIALQAAALKAKHAMALADAIILATARSHNAELLTFDSDFTGLKGANVLRRR
ncbi:MAG: PIN domain-containing protein [Candidatus Micrarchaeota archaeon]|nr:PIN domain-containing protein [Candidatus Micrarchaeota archaeon]